MKRADGENCQSLGGISFDCGLLFHGDYLLSLWHYWTTFCWTRQLFGHRGLQPLDFVGIASEVKDRMETSSTKLYARSVLVNGFKLFSSQKAWPHLLYV